MSSVYVGVDPSISNSGISVIDDTGQLVDCLNGRVAYHKGYRRPEYNILHYQLQVDCIASFLRKFDVKAVAWEGYSLGSHGLIAQLAEFGGMLKSALFNATGIVPYIVAPSSLKKFATGNGRAEKKDVMAQAAKESSAIADMGKLQLTSDVCDAFFLAKYAWYRKRPELAMGMDNTNPFYTTRNKIIAEAR